jgi:hypothetical protein
VLAATLMPKYGPETVSTGLCLICGSRGLADAIVNTVLFIPLGVGLGLTGWPGRRPYVTGALFSASLELSQLFIPGRDASLADVLFNTLGTAVGVLAVRTAVRWLHPDGRVSRRYSMVATIGVLAVVGLSGHLMRYSLPASVYYGQWTPQLGHLEWYRGKVLSASLGPLPIPPQRLADSDAVRSRILSEDTLKVLAVAGPRPPALAPLLSIYDEQQREIILLGLDRDDLVYRYRSSAISVRLEQPEIRVADALRGVQPGDTLELRVWRSGDVHCVSQRSATTCGLAHSPGRGWGLLAARAITLDWTIVLLDFIWLGALAFLAGFWAREGVSIAASAGVLLLGIVVVTAVTVFLSPTPAELLAVCSGFGLGVGGGMAVQSAGKPPVAG